MENTLDTPKGGGWERTVLSVLLAVDRGISGELWTRAQKKTGNGAVKSRGRSVKTDEKWPFFGGALFGNEAGFFFHRPSTDAKWNWEYIREALVAVKFYTPWAVCAHLRQSDECLTFFHGFGKSVLVKSNNLAERLP